MTDTSAFPELGDERVSLYRFFSVYFDSQSISIPANPARSEDEGRATAHLESMPSQARKAVLLIALEGFSTRQSAEILGVDEAECSRLLDSAARETSQQFATDVMIIEDERLIAMDMEDMVETLGHRVTGIARTHTEALDLFRRTKPRMVLADIQLADGSSGIDAVNDILKDDSVPVIFITAFPERLMTGPTQEPAFLMTKPFSYDMVKAMISRALFFNPAVHTETPPRAN